MTPTNNLRWVEQEDGSYELKQLWVHVDGTDEWCVIPVKACESSEGPEE